MDKEINYQFKFITLYIGIGIVVGLKISMKIMLKYNSIYMVFGKCQKIYHDSHHKIA